MVANQILIKARKQQKHDSERKRDDEPKLKCNCCCLAVEESFALFLSVSVPAFYSFTAACKLNGRLLPSANSRRSQAAN
jgi:hypothetical protein